MVKTPLLPYFSPNSSPPYSPTLSSPDGEKMGKSLIRPRRLTVRRVIVTILSLLVLHRLLVLLFSRPRHAPLQAGLARPRPQAADLYRSTWQSLSHALQQARPEIDSVGAFERAGGVSIEQMDAPLNVDAIKLDEAQLQALKQSHANFFKSLTSGQSLSTYYQAGTQGIVTTATATELPQVLVMLRLLRRTHSSLPVEVFLLSRDDYDEKLCRGTFLKLDAHCVVLDELMEGSPMPAMPVSGQPRHIRPQEPLNKLLALFFSRFEDVLLLDPATLTFNNPDMMLKEEPFLSTGMLIWPDFWASTVSPKLASIQAVEGTQRNANRRDSVRTVDLGQLILSKSQHSATLLLSIYYTFFGPDLYEPLLDQSTAGERGAQAIKAAARYLDTPYYMMKRFVDAVGFPDSDAENEGFRGVAMLQAFASDDFHRLPKEQQRPVFVRQTSPTIHPAHIMDRGVTIFKKPSLIEPIDAETDESVLPSDLTVNGAAPLADDLAVAGAKAAIGKEDAFAVPALPPTEADKGKHHRMWEWFSARHISNGWRDPDPERALWEEIATVACIDATTFRVWPSHNRREAKENCRRISYHRGQLGWSEFFVL